MARTCKQCRRPNPSEAVYCYHDGNLLDSQAGNDPAGASALNVGGRPFTVPFVLPSGRSCRNFNQLALACHEDPAAALAVLRKGYLESFLGAQGRTDLAGAARAAARATDRERGLDDFLGRLPAQALLPARLHVEPAALDLGTLRPGEDRRCELVLHNEGMRLLVGSAACDDVSWLSLGDGPLVRSKLFQSSGKTILPVRVVGRRLRAYPKPQEAEVRIESSGGTVTVAVRVNVPVQPFPEGVLAGAVSPRRLAEKARDAPREAAALIESGAVARWYQTNGWTYPVQGPAASGTAAVQQLFEALGLVKPPRVELGEDAVLLRGAPGDKVEHVLAVITQENRAAVAHGSSDQSWLEVGRPVFRGRSAFLPLVVPAVPRSPGHILQARVSVTANGNQHFVVPVTLVVGDLPHGVLVTEATPPEGVAVVPARPVAPVPAATPSSPRAAAGAWPGWRTVLPALLLVMALLGAVLRDLLAPAGNAASLAPGGDPVPRIRILTHDTKQDDVLEKLDMTDPQPTMRFGLVTLRKGEEVGAGATLRRLTFDPWGRTNNTCLRFDGTDERLFGSARGRWEENVAHERSDEEGAEHEGVRSVWMCDDKKIEVTQRVKLVRGEQSNLLDTCRVRYLIVNRDDKEYRVGIRFLLDTFIGGNDGVPFTIPGDSDLCDTFKDLPGAAKDQKLPDFLQALEKPDLAHPGTVAHLRLKLEGLEPPARVTLGAWPNEKLRVLDRKANGPGTLWDVPLLSMKAIDPNDSAVVMYWPEQPLKPGDKRQVGFEYGLWNLASQGSQLATTVDGAFRPGGELTVVAYVNKAGREDQDETVTLEVPEGEGFKIQGDATQTVRRLARDATSSTRPVTWRVEAGSTGKHTLTVTTSAGFTQTVPVEIKDAIFE
jgi:hypothetical protein